MCRVTTKETKAFIRMPYAWPGGYAMFLLMDDGEALCKKCSRSEWPLICDSIRTETKDGWLPQAIVINWEDTDLRCAHCNDNIESAYGENEE